MNSKLHNFLLLTQSTEWREAAETNNLRIVMSNESCDLDSAVSAVVYALLLYSLDEKMGFGSVLPLLNLNKMEYPLRTEVRYWLNKYSISDELLNFRDTIDLSALAKAGNLNLHIVDHNILAPSDAAFDPFVVSVLDHHQLERTDTPVYGMVVEPVGSCCTLVAEQIVLKQPELMDEVIGNLLYGTILLDTVVLSESAKRTTPKDIAMIEYLEEFLKLDIKIRSAVYNEIISAKTDISQLTTKQILRKDLKIVSANNICIAMSSIPLLVKEFLLRENVDEDVHDFIEIFGYDIIVLMGIDVSGEIERDIAVVSGRKILQEGLSVYLQSVKSGVLELELFESSVKDCNVFHQRNKSASRKVVLPLVKEWLVNKR